MKRFTLTEDHLTLLRAANVRWQEGDGGAPGIDCKRPGAELDALLIDGAMARCKTWKHEGKPRIQTIDGAKVKTTGGTISRDPTTGDVANVQLSFADMERAQIQHHRRMLAKSVQTERATIAALDRLLDTMDKAPEARTARESVMAGEEAA